MKASIIIPTKNRSTTLRKALESIEFQSISQDFFEVIIVDNGSNDNTKETVDHFLNKIKNITYIYDESPGLHIGRHRGLLTAKSSILVYADDDIEAFPNWLEGILESFEDQSIALVGGKNLPKFETAPPKWILDLWKNRGNKRLIESLSVLDLGDNIKEINPFYVFGCNFSIRKNVLIEAGGFNPDGMPKEFIKYRGDGESSVSRYILKKGYKTLYNPKASVFHFCDSNRLNKEYFLKRSFNEGISNSYSNIRNGIKKNFTIFNLKLILKKYFLFQDISFQESYLKGYKFHQEHVQKDSGLLEWVKRKNYINNGKI